MVQDCDQKLLLGGVGIHACARCTYKEGDTKDMVLMKTALPEKFEHGQTLTVGCWQERFRALPSERPATHGANNNATLTCVAGKWFDNEGLPGLSGFVCAGCVQVMNAPYKDYDVASKQELYFVSAMVSRIKVIIPDNILVLDRNGALTAGDTNAAEFIFNVTMKVPDSKFWLSRCDSCTSRACQCDCLEVDKASLVNTPLTGGHQHGGGVDSVGTTPYLSVQPCDLSVMPDQLFSLGELPLALQNQYMIDVFKPTGTPPYEKEVAGGNSTFEDLEFTLACENNVLGEFGWYQLDDGKVKFKATCHQAVTLPTRLQARFTWTSTFQMAQGHSIFQMAQEINTTLDAATVTKKDTSVSSSNVPGELVDVDEFALTDDEGEDFIVHEFDHTKVRLSNSLSDKSRRRRTRRRRDVKCTCDDPSGDEGGGSTTDEITWGLGGTWKCEDQVGHNEGNTGSCAVDQECFHQHEGKCSQAAASGVNGAADCCVAARQPVDNGACNDFDGWREADHKDCSITQTNPPGTPRLTRRPPG
jgi:hypothetical protein